MKPFRLASRVTQQSHDNHMIGTYQQLLSMCWGAIWKSWGRLWRRWKSLLYLLFDWYSWQLGLSPDNLIWPATADFSPFYSVQYRDLLISLLCVATSITTDFVYCISSTRHLSTIFLLLVFVPQRGGGVFSKIAIFHSKIHQPHMQLYFCIHAVVLQCLFCHVLAHAI